MHRQPLTHRLLVAVLAGLVAAALLGGCSAKITQDPGSMLAEKVKSNQNAYLRYAQAEEEARRDGRTEAELRYRQAKDKALDDYKRYDQELAAYKTSHSSRLGGDAKP